MTHTVFHEIAWLLLCAAAVGLLDPELSQPVMVSIIGVALILFLAGLTLHWRLVRRARPVRTRYRDWPDRLHTGVAAMASELRRHGVTMSRFAGRLCMPAVAAFALLLSATVPLHAQEAAALADLTRHPVGYLALIIFFAAYGLVAVEEVIQLRKSKPVLLGAGLIWALLGLVYAVHGQSPALEAAAKHVILDYGELMLFLVVAITYVNTMQERRVFDALRTSLVNLRLSYRQLFWLVGGLAFVFGPIIDNLTTALVMGAVVVAVGVNNYQFIDTS